MDVGKTKSVRYFDDDEIKDGRDIDETKVQKTGSSKMNLTALKDVVVFEDGVKGLVTGKDMSGLPVDKNIVNAGGLIVKKGKDDNIIIEDFSDKIPCPTPGLVLLFNITPSLPLRGSFSWWI